MQQRARAAAPRWYHRAIRYGGAIVGFVVALALAGVVTAQGEVPAPRPNEDQATPPDESAGGGAGGAAAEPEPSAPVDQRPTGAGWDEQPSTSARPPDPQKVAACRAAEACRRKGRCTPRGDQCVAGSSADCQSSARCRDQGRCTAQRGRCVAGSQAECWGSTGCRRDGRCTISAGQCVVGSVVDCRRSAGCQVQGACTVMRGRCVAGSNADCQQAAACRQLGRCVAVVYECTTAAALVRPAPREEDDGVPTGLSVKATTGFGYGVLKQHPIVALAGNLALGVQARDIIAFHAECGFWKGETDQSLGFFMASPGLSAELALWRVRPGLGFQGHWLSVERATTGGSLSGWGYSGRLLLDVDIVQSDHANLIAGATGSAGSAGSDMMLFTAALGLGGRFKFP